MTVETGQHPSVVKAKEARSIFWAIPIGIGASIFFMAAGAPKSFGLMIYILGFVIALGGYWFQIYNILTSLGTKIEALTASFDESVRRKVDLQRSISGLADSVASNEERLHGGLAKELRGAASDMARSNNPSLILANLAAQYPQLNSSGAFSAAQSSARDIEAKLDNDVRIINTEIAAFNEIVTTFPSKLAASYEKMEYKGVAKSAEAEPATS